MDAWKKVGMAKRGIMLFIALALVFVAGCQAMGNVDFNKMLKNSLKVTSLEGKQSLELKLLLNEDAYEGVPEEELALIQLISNVKVQLDDIKVQDQEHASYKGKLIFGESTSIGFSLKQSAKAAIIEIEGANAPIVLDLTEEGLTSLLGVAPDEETAAALDEESLAAMGQQIIDGVGSYMIDNLPNPDKLSVTTVSEPINGVSTSLVHIQAELDGPQIWAWVKKYLDALVADRAGLDTMIANVLTILSQNPAVWEALGTVNPLEQTQLDGPTNDELIKEAADELSELLLSLQDQIKQMEETDQETLDQLFNTETKIKADVYVDSKLDIRKQVVEATIKPGELLFPLDGIVIRSESEQWNVNGTVKADEVVVPEQAVSVDDLLYAESYELLKLFNKESVAYDILKNKLHVGLQTVALYPDYDYNPPIVTPAYITIIPLRDVAEQLGAEVDYDKKTKSISVYDSATNTTVVLKENSDTIVVNGKTVKWAFPAKTIDGVLYVPARDFANLLGATVQWSTFYGDEKVFIIQREVG